ncbi:hypothetical protein [Deinococcus sonorensis]|uniref:Uncharacterized protein n=2 Tax=Deinococcus sonorensis TaxID=309891 RepID=A0AAU7UCN1_9DEIO
MYIALGLLCAGFVGLQLAGAPAEWLTGGAALVMAAVCGAAALERQQYGDSRSQVLGFLVLAGALVIVAGLSIL